MVSKDFLNDENGQGAAEYIMLFGGVIVMSIAALLIYKSYTASPSTLNVASDLNSVRGSVK
jgi:hypothetical protein